LVAYAGKAEDARGVDDRSLVLLDEDRQKRPGSIDHAVEVDVPQPLVVFGIGVEQDARLTPALLKTAATTVGVQSRTSSAKDSCASASRTSRTRDNTGPEILASVSFNPRSSMSVIATGLP
jgi:hypothetical protein